jgi:hypothetical protein
LQWGKSRKNGWQTQESSWLLTLFEVLLIFGHKKTQKSQEGE